MTSTDPSLALVLSGGGARGAFEAGVVRHLHRAGLHAGVIAGTSAGAITGAAVACGWSADRIVELWTSLRTHDVLRPRLDVHRLVRPGALLRGPRYLLGLGRASTTETLLDALGWSWLLHLGPLRELLVEELGGERLPLRDDVTLTLTAVEVETGRLLRFCNRDLRQHDRDRSRLVVADLTVDHVLASAAIPGLFRPVEVDGVQYWDGGLTSNTPLNAALAHAPERVVVVGTSPSEPAAAPPKSIGDVVAMAIDHVLRAALVHDVDHAETVNELVRGAPDATVHRAIELATVLPDSPIEGLGDLLDFEPEVSRELVAAGERIAAERLADW